MGANCGFDSANWLVFADKAGQDIHLWHSNCNGYYGGNTLHLKAKMEEDKHEGILCKL